MNDPAEREWGGEQLVRSWWYVIDASMDMSAGAIRLLERLVRDLREKPQLTMFDLHIEYEPLNTVLTCYGLFRLPEPVTEEYAPGHFVTTAYEEIEWSGAGVREGGSTWAALPPREGTTPRDTAQMHNPLDSQPARTDDRS